jgi:hypothetical protein
MSSSYSDTAYPLDLDQAGRPLSAKYSAVQSLQGQLIAFEKNVPYALRCRTSLLSLPSLYPEPLGAIAESPEVDRRNLGTTLQVSIDWFWVFRDAYGKQFTLAITISETMLFLNRSFYARAIQESMHDPTQSQYGQSYLTVVERSNVRSAI